jgi:pimeloyl-ACP methyl ester carboxylesterase
MDSFAHEGHSISYEEHGSGDRPLVLAHGLLMNRGMFDRLGPEMAARGNRVVCVDLLGHGESDRPPELGYYSMSAFADQIAGLLDHLGVEQAVVGGTSLGANVSLEVAARHPDRVRALVIEMPVLENALVSVAVIFTPLLVGAQLGAPALRLLAGATRRLPRTHYLIDIMLDWVRRDPKSSIDVLQGLLLGRTAPPAWERRELRQPALVIGHRADPLHQFSDADMLVEEMPDARLVNADSILEWRLRPERLNDELTTFLDQVWKRAPDGPAAGAAGRSPRPVR